MADHKNCLIICPNPSIDILARAEKIEAGTTNRFKEERRYPGGKGIHVALALAELGVPVSLFAIWGKENGKALINACTKYCENIELLGPFVEGWNRSCYTLQSSDKEWNDTELLGEGPLMDHAAFESILNIITERKRQLQSVAVCGSWPNGAQDNYNQIIIEHCASFEIPVYIDCTGMQLENALKAKPFCVHLNKHEVTEYFDMSFDKAKYAMKELCSVSAVTNGSEGLYLISSEEEIHANVQVSEVKSTVGSGDCLMAGIISGYYKSLPFEEIARMGVACGAANCIEEKLGMLNHEDVKHLFTSTITKVLEINIDA